MYTRYLAPMYASESAFECPKEIERDIASRSFGLRVGCYRTEAAQFPKRRNARSGEHLPRLGTEVTQFGEWNRLGHTIQRKSLTTEAKAPRADGAQAPPARCPLEREVRP